MKTAGIILAVVAASALCSAEPRLSYQDLNKAFEHGSSAELGKLVTAFARTQAPVSAEQLAAKPEFERHAYAIFQAFYTEEHVLAFWQAALAGRRDAAPEEMRRYRFIGVQNELPVVLLRGGDLPRNVDQMEFADFARTISVLGLLEFRPNVAIAGLGRYYVSRSAEQNLGIFLRGNPKLDGKDAVQKRREFLAHQIPAHPSGMAGTVEFRSDPIVDRIVLNQAMDQGIVYFRVGSRLGIFPFRRQGALWQPGEWRLTGNWD